jgi:parvulin-like peptidyl-prolyl isomerase
MTRFALAVICLTVLVGCGSSGGVSSADIGVVCGQHVTRAQFDALIRQGRAAYKLRKEPFPQPGSAKYEAIKGHIVQLLVDHAEIAREAARLGIKVSPAEVDAEVRQLLQTQFKGNRKAFDAALAKDGLDEAELRSTFESNLVQRKLSDRLTRNVKVGDAAIRAYYEQYKAQYKTRRRRLVRELLVKKQALAAELVRRLQAGASFAQLAKQYSVDKATRAGGGRLLAQDGALIAPVSKVVFALKTGAISQPVGSTLGWYVIEALGPVQPPRQIPLAQVRLPIVQYLLGQKRRQVVTTWLGQVRDRCSKDARYAKGFAPPQG